MVLGPGSLGCRRGGCGGVIDSGGAVMMVGMA